MNLSTDLNSKEILFHLNYMGYKNVSKDQLKTFMNDLKKLIKYENNLVRNEVKMQAGPTNVNIRRLFDSQDIRTSKPAAAPEKVSEELKRPKTHIEQMKKAQTKQNDNNKDPRKIFQIKETDDGNKPSNKKIVQIQQPATKITSQDQKNDGNDKENLPTADQPLIKPKGFIRPRSTSQTRTKKSDPVALYQSYQKDWQRFKTNMCESSHSDLRWSIREKMMGVSRPT